MRTAVCEPRCMNGGYCAAPNQCSCTLGYIGKHCQIRKCRLHDVAKKYYKTSTIEVFLYTHSAFLLYFDLNFEYRLICVKGDMQRYITKFMESGF